MVFESATLISEASVCRVTEQANKEGVSISGAHRGESCQHDISTKIILLGDGLRGAEIAMLRLLRARAVEPRSREDGLCMEPWLGKILLAGAAATGFAALLQVCGFHLCGAIRCWL